MLVIDISPARGHQWLLNNWVEIVHFKLAVTQSLTQGKIRTRNGEYLGYYWDNLAEIFTKWGGDIHGCFVLSLPHTSICVVPGSCYCVSLVHSEVCVNIPHLVFTLSVWRQAAGPALSHSHCTLLYSRRRVQCTTMYRPGDNQDIIYFNWNININIIYIFFMEKMKETNILK